MDFVSLSFPPNCCMNHKKAEAGSSPLSLGASGLDGGGEGDEMDRREGGRK